MSLVLIVLEKSSAILWEATFNKLLLLGWFFQVLRFSGSDLHLIFSEGELKSLSSRSELYKKQN